MSKWVYASMVGMLMVGSSTTIVMTELIYAMEGRRSDVQNQYFFEGLWLRKQQSGTLFAVHLMTFLFSPRGVYVVAIRRMHFGHFASLR